MTDEDFVFYEDQKSRRIGKCLDVALPLTSSDQKFIRRSESHINASSSQCQNEIITLSTTHYLRINQFKIAKNGQTLPEFVNATSYRIEQLLQLLTVS